MHCSLESRSAENQFYTVTFSHVVAGSSCSKPPEIAGMIADFKICVCDIRQITKK